MERPWRRSPPPDRPARGLFSSSDHGVAAVSVVAAEASEAEILAKAALIAGPETGAALLADAMVPAVMTMDDGTTDCVGGWQEFER